MQGRVNAHTTFTWVWNWLQHFPPTRCKIRCYFCAVWNPETALVFFYRCPQHRSSYGMSQRMGAFCAIRLRCSKRRQKKRPLRCAEHRVCDKIVLVSSQYQVRTSRSLPCMNMSEQNKSRGWRLCVIFGRSSSANRLACGNWSFCSFLSPSTPVLGC